MAFMDVLSKKTDGLCFDREYVRHIRDSCLLSIVDGKIAHFLEALEGMHIFNVKRNVATHVTTDAFSLDLQGRLRMSIFLD